MSANRTAPKKAPKKRVSFKLQSSSPSTSTPSHAANPSANNHSLPIPNRLSGSASNATPQPPQVHALPATPWPFNEQDTHLISAGYQPQWTPKKSETEPPSRGKKSSAMAEPRARMARHKGQMNFQNERVSHLSSGLHQPNQANASQFASYSSPTETQALTLLSRMNRSRRQFVFSTR